MRNHLREIQRYKLGRALARAGGGRSKAAMAAVKGLLSRHGVGGSDHPRTLHEQFVDVQIRPLTIAVDSDPEVILIDQSPIHGVLHHVHRARGIRFAEYIAEFVDDATDEIRARDASTPQGFV